MTGRIRLAALVIGVCCTATACGGGSTPPPQQAAAVAPPAPKVLTATERADWYRGCWDKFNAKAWEDFRACYSDAAEVDPVDTGRPAMRGPETIVTDARKETASLPDMRGDLSLILVNGTNIAGIAVVTATNSQPMANPGGTKTPATDKTIGLWLGHAIQTDASGAKVTREAQYVDSATMAAQLGLLKAPLRAAMPKPTAPPTVIVATNSATESANLAAEQKTIDDWNAHDAKALGEALSDDLAWHEAALPADLDKKGLVASLKEFWGGISNVKLTPANIWAAGDYVVVQGAVAGVNDGNMPSMGIQKTGKPVTLHFLEIDRFEGGKLEEGWLFYDGGAMMRQLAAK